MKMFKSLISIALVAMIMLASGLSAVAVEPTVDERIELAVVYTKDHFAAEFDSETGFRTADMWSLMTAFSAGVYGDSDYGFLIPNYSASDFDESSTITDYSKAVISLCFMGINPYEFDGINLVERLIEADSAQTEDLANVLPFTIIALELASADYDNNAMVDRLTALQKPDGGYNWDSAAEVGDVDVTAQVITALVMTEYGISKVDAAADFIKSTADENGHFVSPGGYTYDGIFYPYTANVNTQAMAILGLADSETDITDAQIDALFSYQTEEGGFVYDEYADAPDYYSTHQAIMALSVLKMINEGDDSSEDDGSSSGTSDVSDDSSVPENSELSDIFSDNSKAVTANTNPKTGDDGINIIFLVVAFVAVLLIAVCVILAVTNKKKPGGPDGGNTPDDSDSDTDGETVDNDDDENQD